MMMKMMSKKRKEENLHLSALLLITTENFFYAFFFFFGEGWGQAGVVNSHGIVHMFVLKPSEEGKMCFTFLFFSSGSTQ